MNSILLAGNWKMNGNMLQVNQLIDAVLLAKIPAIEWMIFPPSIYLSTCQQRLLESSVAWGAQDVSAHCNGAYTGEVSASMLADMDCRNVLIGHSERRHGLGEDNAVIAEKFARALEENLQPILCVGETLTQRESGESEAAVLDQLASVFPCLTISQPKQLIVAYEPVWAIGTGVHASTSDVASMHQSIADYITSETDMLPSQVRVLYGGSVKPSNAEPLILVDRVDGFLVGGASLNNQFTQIGEICSSLF